MNAVRSDLIHTLHQHRFEGQVLCASVKIRLLMSGPITLRAAPALSGSVSAHEQQSAKATEQRSTLRFRVDSSPRRLPVLALSRLKTRRARFLVKVQAERLYRPTIQRLQTAQRCDCQECPLRHDKDTYRLSSAHSLDLHGSESGPALELPLRSRNACCGELLQ